MNVYLTLADANLFLTPITMGNAGVNNLNLSLERQPFPLIYCITIDAFH